MLPSELAYNESRVGPRLQLAQASARRTRSNWSGPCVQAIVDRLSCTGHLRIMRGLTLRGGEEERYGGQGQGQAQG